MVNCSGPFYAACLQVAIPPFVAFTLCRFCTRQPEPVGWILAYAVGQAQLKQLAAKLKFKFEGKQMKRTPDLQVKNRKTVQLAALILTLATLAANISAKAQSITYEADNEHNSASIEGSWIFDIDVSVAGRPVAAFNSLISFGAGGIVVTS